MSFVYSLLFFLDFGIYWSLWFEAALDYVLLLT